VLLLPRLKQLRLFDVGITKIAMHRLFTACTALEGLQLQEISGFSTLSIRSPSLGTIGVFCWSYSRGLNVFYRLVIEDAPSLERMILLDRDVPTDIKVIDALKLTVLGFVFNDMSQLFIGDTTADEVSSSSIFFFFFRFSNSLNVFTSIL
jgi:hypothetical protein